MKKRQGKGQRRATTTHPFRQLARSKTCETATQQKQIQKPLDFILPHGIIGNRQSAIGNRQSAIGNRQSAIGNMKICNNIFKKSADSRISHSRSLHQLALKTLAALCFLAAASAPTLAQTVPTISCDTDPAIFNTGIAPDGLGGYSANSGHLSSNDLDVHWKYARISGGGNTSGSADPATIHQHPSNFPFLSWGTTFVNPSAYWSALPTTNSLFISPSTGGTGTIWYRYVFDLADSVHPSAFSLPVTLIQDDNLYHIWVNTTDNFQIPSIGYGTFALSNATLSTGWQAGENQIFVTTHNYTGNAGLWLYTGTQICTEKLSLTKTTTQSTAVAAGQTNIPFEIVVANKGAAFPAGAVLNDPLPAGFASGTWTCSNNGTTATCPAASGVLPISNLELPALPAGSSLHFNILATAQSAANLLATTSIENAAALKLPQSFVAKDVCLETYDVGANACTAAASVATGGYLDIRKTVHGSGPFFAGNTVTYDITLSNAGSVDLSDITVADTLPAGLSNGTWTCQVPAGSSAVCPALAPPASNDMPLNQSGITLPAHASLVYTVTATVDAVRAPGTLASTEATASIATAGASCWNGSASSAPPCTASANIAVLVAPRVSAVPLFGLWAYGLTGFCIFVLAATARRIRAAAN